MVRPLAYRLMVDDCLVAPSTRRGSRGTICGSASQLRSLSALMRTDLGKHPWMRCRCTDVPRHDRITFRAQDGRSSRSPVPSGGTPVGGPSCPVREIPSALALRPASSRYPHPDPPGPALRRRIQPPAAWTLVLRTDDDPFGARAAPSLSGHSPPTRFQTLPQLDQTSAGASMARANWEGQLSVSVGLLLERSDY